jgi:hypothetical protein
MENVLKHNNKIMISKGELNAIILHGILYIFYVCPKQHTFPPHENTIL